MASTAASSSACSSLIQCARRIRCPIDHLIMQPLDTSQNLQSVVHRRYEAEWFHEGRDAAAAASSDGGNEPQRFGLATLIVGNNIPAYQSRLEKWLDPAPHPTLSLRITVMDRIHWQRSSWLAGSICKSLCWGRIPKAIFSIPLDWQKEVKIDTSFDAVKQRFDHFKVSVPEHNFSMTLKDTSTTLFDRQSRIVEGFLDNESALKQLGLAREVCMSGLGNAVYRQTLWSTPCLPNVAEVTDLQCGSLFQHYLACAEPSRLEPVAAWVLDEVPETLIYAMEGHVEDENDPNSATTYGERSLVERVQKKAMNRYSDFRDEVRTKTYSDLDGRESPR